METCSKKGFETNKDITKIMENEKYTGNEYLISLKIKFNGIKRINRLKINSINGKRKFIHKNKKKEIKNIQESNISKNESNSIINKSLPKIQLYLNYIFNQKIQFLNSIIIILIIKLFFILCECNSENLLFKYSEIALKINGTGNLNIFSNKFLKKYNQYEIYINDSIYYQDQNEYHFNYSENITLKVKWNITITNASNMFNNCDNIFEIDLSNFDTSQVTDISYMFYNCSSLISLNLDSLNTSQVINMSYMFYNCSLLTSLNLDNFETLKVSNMSYMLYKCSSLN